jgi:hypothetical protein
MDYFFVLFNFAFFRVFLTGALTARNSVVRSTSLDDDSGCSG